MSLIKLVQKTLARRQHEDQFGGWATAVYDFSIHGGAIGAITLPLVLPAGAEILYGFAVAKTAITSGGSATVALSIEGANDLISAVAITILDAVNERAAMIPTWAPANVVRLTADRKLTLTVAVAALTAGKVEFRLYYTVPVNT